MGAPAVRVGLLHDFRRADGGAAFEWGVRLGFSAVAANDGPRDVAFVHALADGGAASVRAAFDRLVEADVVAIVGPALTDGALAACPLADEARVVCLNYAGDDEARGRYMFHFQLGSLEDEPSLVADHLARRGLRRVGLVQDRSHVGNRTAAFFRLAAATTGCEIVAHEVVETDDDGVAAVARLRRADPDALVCVGFWRAARAVAVERRRAGWLVPAFGNSALMYGHADPAWARDWDGWMYVDTFSAANPRYAALATTVAATGRAAGPGDAAAYDMGRLIAEGLVRAPSAGHDGLRAGMERIKALRPATGRPGAVMGFGNWDRGALKGEYLVLREWRNGESVELPSP